MKSNNNILTDAPPHSNNLWEMNWIVAALNGADSKMPFSKAHHQKLVAFVESWNKSGRNPLREPFSKLIAEDAPFSLEELARAFTWDLVSRPGDSGAMWEKRPSELAYSNPSLFYAALLFANPLRMKLSDGPCQRPACQRWFIKTRENQKTCSRRCLGVVRSVAAMKEQRKREHEERLELAQQLISKWEGASAKEKKKHGSWKEFVESKSKKNVSKKFITRAVNNKELRSPKGGGK